MSRTRPSPRPNSLPRLRFCSRSLLIALVVVSATACGGDPTGYEAPTVVATVSAGDSHTMILKTDGMLWATGLNGYGQLGDGTRITRTTPVEVTF